MLPFFVIKRVVLFTGVFSFRVFCRSNNSIKTICREWYISIVVGSYENKDVWWRLYYQCLQNFQVLFSIFANCYYIFY